MVKFKHVVPFASLFLIGILYVLSLFSHPAYIGIGEVGDYEGRTVVVNGMLTGMVPLESGAGILSVRDTNDSSLRITLFVQKMPGHLSYGDLLSATGKVERYENEWEIIVDSASDIIVTGNSGDNFTKLWQLSQDPARFSGIMVNVPAELYNPHSTYFYLKDGGFKLKVLCPADFAGNFTSGESIAVAGIFSYDPDNLAYYLDARCSGAASAAFTE
ncbi:MAG: hypothetical protein CVT48_00635 [Thermoplasmata archaeon HGW-Thermoplasmata-1]|nr:MAG: hypothetical protein CVT48_00635 [Thermoplasmata archaeon HGW-Thermoplasmata-1]